MRTALRVPRLLLLPLLAAAACSQDTSIHTEIVPLAPGEFYNLSWGGTQTERFYAVARPGTPDSRTPHAALIAPDLKVPCSLGDDISIYRPLLPRSKSKYVLGAP